MIKSINPGGPMRNFTAYILRPDGDQRALHLVAKDISTALLNAKELTCEGEVFLHLVEQGDW